MSPRDVLKVFVFHQKDADKTDEEFEKHVCDNINPASVIKTCQATYGYEILDFEKRRTSCLSNVCGAPAAMVERFQAGWAVINSHAVLTYWVRDMSLASDSEYHEIGRKLEKSWIDSTRGEVMVGYEKVLIDNKEIVDGTIEK
ncbi:unnamed protein product [Colletotrichum noveboracense]|uniref:EthD domain-containing protein n=1 Tax=Colletotrichum noveboracense TaxID=2664923 RepID=A0A9W4RLU2_9PEZI|nr:unnamed protein product [Colletotrichum noveboracense]